MTLAAHPLAENPTVVERLQIFKQSDTRAMLKRSTVVAMFVAAACTDAVGPLPPIPAGTFSAVTGGFEQTCGLVGTVPYCWGQNHLGQLGTGEFAGESLPRLVAGGLQLEVMDIGTYHACGVTIAGTAYCWGTNTWAALGSDTIAANTSVPVSVDGNLTFQTITVGRVHTCGLTTTGTAYCWGDNILGNVGVDTATHEVRTPNAVLGGLTFTAIAAGDYHTCALAPLGVAYCWGENTYGQLGTGDTATTAPHPSPEPVVGGLAFKAIAAGNAHTCGVTTTGAIYCWGAGAWGQLGNTERTDQRVPVRVSGSNTYMAVSLGFDHSCALETDRRLFCWGSNAEWGLGATAPDSCPSGPTPGYFLPCATTPILSAGGRTFRSVSVGSAHTCAIGVTGGAYCWGNNSYGQIGNGASDFLAPVTTPIRVSDPEE